MNPFGLPAHLSRQHLLMTQGKLTVPVATPWHGGQVACASALAELAAQGAEPLMAALTLGQPQGTSQAAMREMEAGWRAQCAVAGVSAGSVQVLETTAPTCVVTLTGLLQEAHARPRDGAQVGDQLILGKPLGTGLLAQAYAQGLLAQHDYAHWLQTVTQPHTPALALTCLEGVHCTVSLDEDGLLPVLEAMALRAQGTVRCDFERISLLPHALELASRLGSEALPWKPYSTGLPGHLPEAARRFLAAGEVAGGLVVSCRPEVVTEVLSIFLQQGFEHASVIGHVLEGAPEVVFN